MRRGRRPALALAWGVTTGSAVWAVGSALGFGAILAAHQWLAEAIRVAGGLYLGRLAWRSARSAPSRRDAAPADVRATSLGAAWAKGALIHLGNPKAVVFWGSIFAVGPRPGAPPEAVWTIVAVCVAIDLALVSAYALLFSGAPLTAAYLRARRWLEASFAAFFGAAAAFLPAQRTG